MNLLNKNRRKIAVFLLVVFLGDIISPTMSWALTGGPSQPEVQAFEPAQTVQMVDKSTGDFTYNLPLMDVGGYPVNISYHSGITMDQEASWVGLGWNINPGVINRQMRGLPDDFDGDPITKEYNIRTNYTIGLDLGVGVSFVELPISLGANAGIYYNNYKGVGFKGGVSFSFSAAVGSNQKDTKTSGLGIQLSLGVQADSQNGIGVMPNVGLSLSSAETNGTTETSTSVGLNVGISYNSRGGLSALTYGLSVSSSIKKADKTPAAKAEEGKADKDKDGKYDVTTSGNGVNSSITRSSSVSFASQPVTPTINFPMENFGFSAKLQLGGFTPIYAAEVNVSADIMGYYSHQKLVKHEETRPGYGYMYMQDAGMEPGALLDFNREKDQPFRKPNSESGDEGTPIMAVPSYQYDLLGVNGQGIGGQYRSMRNDIGHIYDPEVSAWSGSGNFAIDVAFGTYATVGLDVQGSVSNTTTSQWRNGNQLFDDLRYYDYDNTLFEPASFINIGEKTINDQSYYNQIGDVDPIRINIGGGAYARTVTKGFTRFKSQQPHGGGPFTTYRNKQRAKRNQVMSFVTAGEASAPLASPMESIALDREIKDYDENVYIAEQCNNHAGYQTTDRLAQSNGRRSHISEVTVLGADGQRYVYGIPAYNRIQRDVMFNVKHADGNLATGMATYTPNQDNTRNNDNGLDHYFSRETMPPFAHSYLLTAVLSPDYVDLTGNGVSDDDWGTAVKINYSRIHGDTPGSLYNWRMPYEYAKANYQEGFKTDDKDDKGNYSCGKKEVWMMHSIESKTMVALFHMSNREDGLGVLGEDGGMDPNATLRKLDYIDLFAKSDLITQAQGGAQAVPLKTVHFKYSYNLCPNVQNNSTHAVDENGDNPATTGLPNINYKKGKLTLESIYFTYQKNTKGKLNPYVFHYSSFNPDYNLKRYDRWGNYKQNPPGMANEVEFPYTLQNKPLTDQYASAWSMNKIDLPTGGTINVDYESDDYGFVQDKRAQQMFQIEGFGKTADYTQKQPLLYSYSPANPDGDHNNYVFFTATAGTVSTRDEVGKQYIEGIDYCYFRCAVKMYQEHSPDKAEYVPGYCRIADYGPCSDHQHFWIKLVPEPIKNPGSAEVANPILKASMQFLRMNLAKLAYPGSENDPTDFVSVVKSLVAPIFDLQNIFMGFSGSCMQRKWCREIVPQRSWMRLNNPTMSKLGGGLRVKSVTISDKWSQMVTGESDAVYGQVYDYTMQLNEGGPVISSGVAGYEPLNGGDENPFRQPLQFSQKTKMAPHSQFYIEYPIGETFFPAADVIYRKVKISSYGSTLVPAERRTGYTINTFYTAYDFPLSTDHTPLDPYPDNTPSVFAIFSLPKLEHFTASQGFQVELNDMHGKPRSEEVYNNADEVVSRTTYEYVVDNPNASKKHVKNEVTVLMPDGSIKNNVPVGKSVELMADFRHQSTNQGAAGALITIDISSIVPPPIPLPIPTIFPTISFDQTQFRSAATMKVVRRFGILASTTVQQYGSLVKTDNLIYDSETGEVVLTRTRNEYDDPMYNLSYPAHLAYEGMGPAYKNIGAHFTGVNFTTGHITYPTGIETYFTEGDEVLATGIGGNEKLWVINPHHSNSSLPAEKIFVTADGTPYAGSHKDLKIIRSGRRNQASLPIASFLTLKNPIHSDTLKALVGDEIVNTSVTEYKDEWKIRCDKVTTLECDHCNAPSCTCMYNLLKYIADNNLWLAQSGDSVFVNSCCLDSCFYNNGTYSNANCDGCKRHFYAVDPTHDMADGYKAVVGRCTLEVKFSPPVHSLYTFNQQISHLVVPSPEDLTFNETNCTDICSEYETTGKYPLRGNRLGSFSHSFEATLTCPPVCKEVCVDLNDGQKINPYKVGLLGNWRPEKQWVYRDMRTPGTINNAGTTNIRKDGTFVNYERFWVYNSAEGKFVRTPALSAKYVDATTITKYNYKGAEVENMDAAGIYSAALFGYLETQAVAVAKNARYKDLGYDGFEDYVFATTCSNPCRVDHFNFREKLDNGCLAHCGIIDSVDAHTGNYSLKVLSTGAGEVSMMRDLKEDTEDPGIVFDDALKTYKLSDHGCLPKFSPDTGRYFVSAWVKEAQSCNVLQYENAKIRIGYTGSSQIDELLPTGNIIEGWQRIEGVIHVPASATQIQIDLVAMNSVSVNFDDVRVQPFNSAMKTYAYDVRSLRLMAEHDEQNFATFYEYDDEGVLIRVKKETERGIMTVQENRSMLKTKQ